VLQFILQQPVSDNTKYITEGGTTTSEVAISDAQNTYMGKGIVTSGVEKYSDIFTVLIFFPSLQLYLFPACPCWHEFEFNPLKPKLV
jgi:hypothetical protein